MRGFKSPLYCFKEVLEALNGYKLIHRLIFELIRKNIHSVTTKKVTITYTAPKLFPVSCILMSELYTVLFFFKSQDF